MTNFEVVRFRDSCLLTVNDIPYVDIFHTFQFSIAFGILTTFFEFRDGVC